MLNEKQAWQKIGDMFYGKADEFPFICWKIWNLRKSNQITPKLCDKMTKTVKLDVELYNGLNHFHLSFNGEWDIFRADYCYLMSYTEEE